MPARKTTAKGTRRRAPRRFRKRPPIAKLIGAVALLAFVVFGAVLLVRWLGATPDRTPSAERKKPPAQKEAPLPRGRTPGQAPAEKPAPRTPEEREAAPEKAPLPKPPVHEVFPEKPPEPPSPETDSLHASLPPPPPDLPVPSRLPKVAIIIDDLGYDRNLAEKFVNLGSPLTLSILPHSPHADTISRMAAARGFEIMLHLPMEPIEYPGVDPGPGALLSSMGADELLRVLEKNLDAVPHVKGVNNHMGSRLTASSEQMYQVFSVLKRRGLFFVDSRTTEESVCKPSARLFQIPFARRDVFLDHYPEPAFIRQQIRQLIRIARRQGEAVGIAHPSATTYRILKEELPALRQQVEIVPASNLVRVAG
jgi:hypothetical protein